MEENEGKKEQKQKTREACFLLTRTLIQKDTSTSMFTAALFATAKTWNPNAHQRMTGLRYGRNV